MSRDMQIGLLLAVGFLALVGGVLYYRIEHPDELEQFLSGNETQTTASNTSGGPDTTKPDVPPAPANSGTGGTASTVASNTNVLPAPVNNPPPFDPVIPSNPPSLSNNSPVLQTSAPSIPPTGSTTASTSNDTKKPIVSPDPAMGAAGVLALDVLGVDKKADDKKTVSSVPAADQKKPGAPSTARTSLPMEPPGMTPPVPPVATTPSIALDLTPKTTTPPPGEIKKATESVIKPDASASNGPPAGVTPPSMSPPGFTPPSTTGASLPIPPVGGRIVMTDPAKSQTTPEKNSNELPQSPVVTPPGNGGITFDTTKPAPSSGVAPPPMTSNTNAPPSGTSTPSLGGTPPMNSPLNTTITPTNSPGNVTPANTNPPPVADGDGFRTSSPKAGLGKPMPESEVALREKRWGDAAGNPAPIIPSSVDNRNNASNVMPAMTTGRRGGVVQDSYMPTERTVPGETFSTLSQRLYGDTNYAVALAAFNKEEGFVKLDQPAPGELVAKPNREILDQKYPQLVRRLTPANLNPNNMAMMANNANAKSGTAPAAQPTTSNLPTYRVGKGEQLFEVAKKTLGDGYRWSEIYALNKDMLRDSTELRPDMVLKLPAEARK